MKRKFLGSGLLAVFLSLAVGAFAVPGPEFDDENPGPGPGPGLHPDKPRMMMMGGYGMMGGYSNTEMQTIAETYRIKIERVFLDAKESRVSLNAKRRDLYAKIMELSGQYPGEKSVGQDIVKSIRELNGIQEQIRVINEKAMKRIQELNDQREKELRRANESWMKKIETDEKELERYVGFLNDRRPYQKPALHRMRKK